MNTTTEYPPRHINGFRPLVPGEQWHRTDFTPDMLPEGWRPLIDGETWNADDQVKFEHGNWQTVAHWFAQTDSGTGQGHCRTRRPLPPPPPTFEHGGKVWTSHVPGDPCPVADNEMVEIIASDCSRGTAQAKKWGWPDKVHPIIGYCIPGAVAAGCAAWLRERIAELEQKLSDELHHTVTLNERITELEFLLEDERKKYLGRSQHIEDLEHDLRTALTPRPIAEAGEVKEGFERIFFSIAEQGIMGLSGAKWMFATHFIDIKLPAPDPRAEYERALAECGGDPVALYAKMKGGAA